MGALPSLTEASHSHPPPQYRAAAKHGSTCHYHPARRSPALGWRASLLLHLVTPMGCRNGP